MKNKVFSIIITLSLFFPKIYAQKILEEKTIQSPGKSLGVFSVFGTKSVVSGAGPSDSGITSITLCLL